MTSQSDSATKKGEQDVSLQQEVLREYLDATDYEIFQALNEDGRMSDTELAERVGLSRTAVRRRREQLLDDGLLDVLAVVVLQEGGFAYGDVLVYLDNSVSVRERERLIEQLIDAELIYSVDSCLGEYDLFVRLWHHSMNELKSYVWKQFEQEPAVEDFTLVPVAKTWKAWDKELDRPSC